MQRIFAVALLVPVFGASSASAKPITRLPPDREACSVYRALETRFVEAVRVLPLEEARKKALELRSGVDEARAQCQRQLDRRRAPARFALFRSKPQTQVQ